LTTGLIIFPLRSDKQLDEIQHNRRTALGHFTMKAITYRSFGSPEVLVLEDVPAPAVHENGVLVSVRASSVNVIDSRSRNGVMSPFVDKKFPKIPGVDVAGVVLGVGAKVRRLKAGDRVFGATNAFKGGAFAERVSVPENSLAPMPLSVDFPEAAAVPIAGLAALKAIRDLGRVRKGDNVLIYGSSGAVGLFTIQLAKYFGAQVTTVSGTAGAEASRAMGADRALDYRAGPVALVSEFDIIVDYSGAYPFAIARKHLKRKGRFIESSPTIPKFLASMIANPFRLKKHLMLTTAANFKDLESLASLIDAAKLRITIARSYPLSEAKQAFVDHERGGTVGKIVVTAG
jgi:NADPH:quinone reductase-like Zn-dependent oxidoreductase